MYNIWMFQFIEVAHVFIKDNFAHNIVILSIIFIFECRDSNYFLISKIIDNFKCVYFLVIDILNKLHLPKLASAQTCQCYKVIRIIFSFLIDCHDAI